MPGLEVAVVFGVSIGVGVESSDCLESLDSSEISVSSNTLESPDNLVLAPSSSDFRREDDEDDK